MRVSITTAAAALLLPALASAQAAAPPPAGQGLGDRLSSLWAKVAPYVPEMPNVAAAMPSKASLPSLPKKATKNVIAPRAITNLTAKNWAATLGGSGVDSSNSLVEGSGSGSSSVVFVDSVTAASRPWLVLVSGGNSTCYGKCKQLDAAWALAAAHARTDARAPNLAYVDCESNRLLCATWGAAPGEAWWIEAEEREARAADTEAARVTAVEAEVEGAAPLHAKAAGLLSTRRDIYVIKFNTTTVGADDIARLYKKGEYKTSGQLLEAESPLSRHPFDSKLARMGLNTYVGYVYFALGMIPSWTFMLMMTMTMRMFSRGAMAKNQETPQQKAERERKEKYTADGKVRGAPPGDGRSSGML